MIPLGTRVKSISVDYFTLHVNNLHLPVEATGKKVKVLFGDDALNVEPAVARILAEAGCEVLNGDQVHLAGHVITGKFMAVGHCDVFKNWARHYGYVDSRLDDILARADRILSAYLAGEDRVGPDLVASLVERWDIYNAPVEKRKQDVRVLADFWLKNPTLLRRWVSWYKKLPYDPGGAPDLFAWDRKANEWAWFEVKSVGDSIRGNQWEWIFGFSENVSPDVGIVRILPME